jgi:hypothetical protein
MRTLSLIVLLCLCTAAFAEEAVPLRVQVTDPYIEIHTGPGRGYPVFHVASRGDWVDILSRHTDWFRIRTENGIEGWVDVAEIQQTLNPDGSRLVIKSYTHEDFISRTWEMGVLSGDFGGAAIISFYGAYRFTDNISTELSLSQVLGNVSSSVMIGATLVQEPFPEWRVSPFFALGTGIINTTPRASLGISQDSSDSFTHFGLGARMHLTKRLLLRVNYNKYVVYPSRNLNEDIIEWKAGFAFFY